MKRESLLNFNSHKVTMLTNGIPHPNFKIGMRELMVIKLHVIGIMVVQ